MKKIDHPEISRILVYRSKEETAGAAAKEITDLVAMKPEVVITYATGATMVPVYKQLSLMEADFSKTKAFHLDEYFPCSAREDHSFVKYLRELVFEPLRILSENRFEINGEALDGEKEAKRYNEALKAQAVDLAILGVGPGGHIGFNEAGTDFSLETHLTDLAKETVYRDQVLRGEATPKQAITQGVANILAAGKIILVAYGKEKGEILKTALWGPIEAICPASALRKVGQKVTILIDEEAAEVF